MYEVNTNGQPMSLQGILGGSGSGILSELGIGGNPSPIAGRAPARYVEQDGKHKGVAGAGRDILGFLGDFLLTKLGMPAMYGPAQKARKMGVATSQADPQTRIDMITDLDPAFGAKLNEQAIDNRRVDAQNAQTNQFKEAAIDQRKQIEENKNQERLFKMKSYSSGSFVNAMAQGTAAQRKQQYKNAYELNKKNFGDAAVEGLPTPEMFTDDNIPDIVNYTNQYISPEQQEKLRLSQERIQSQKDIAEGSLGVRKEQVGVAKSRVAATIRGQDKTAATAKASLDERTSNNNVRAAQNQDRIDDRVSRPSKGQTRKSKSGKPIMFDGKNWVYQ